MLANPIVQFIPKPLLLAIADFEDFAFKSFPPFDFVFQFSVRGVQFLGLLEHAGFQRISGVFADSRVTDRFVLAVPTIAARARTAPALRPSLRDARFAFLSHGPFAEN